MVQARLLQFIFLSCALPFLLVSGHARSGNNSVPAGGSNGDMSDEGPTSQNLSAPTGGSDNAATPAGKSGVSDLVGLEWNILVSAHKAFQSFFFFFF
ncbi:hypothetical protein CROQUDRAFT_188092 [Cronartium quercuum f. sp. fusiforme G11]|uniref:Uncharacterized protein n=1 Tax=Cronartium quercuum f. sp. fusiforme G11 TaxID=708437 RepID=A0A9P6T8S6_9BASI|nr:hypothetical protein CROQUDRAFT_188092 [Cronartium quercuum f. sp. fusiforme G11]